jgi:hypothetical protein
VSLYAAYGIDLDPAQMQHRCPSSPVRGPGWLTGWRLTFGGEDLADAQATGGALATVVQDRASTVFVLLYDVAPVDEDALQMWEGETYRSLKIRIETLEGSVMAWTFVLDAYEGGLPAARYLGDLADSAELAGAPSDYVQSLRLRPCRSHPSSP